MAIGEGPRDDECDEDCWCLPGLECLAMEATLAEPHGCSVTACTCSEEGDDDV